jgi:ABC-2 type transport system permease protein
VTYAAPAGPVTGSVDPRAGWLRLPGRVGTLCLLELQRLRHDPYELLTRLVQPALWLLIFGTTFSQLRAIPTGGVPYLDFLAPGILAQSALFIAIFFGIQVISDRDAGVLAKLMVTPTPRSALVAGKAFAAGIRAAAQGVVVLLIALLLGVSLVANPLRILAAFGVLILSAAFFACLSIVLAGLVVRRDRLMGIGQAIIMPLFFASNALYPIELIPGWLRWLAYVNPLSYEVDALRALMLQNGASAFGLSTDFAVLLLTTAVLVLVGAYLYPRVIL